MDEEKIGERLRRLRLKAGLSQRELAKRSGVDREYICQIEGNKVKSITLRIAEALAKGLGRPPAVFFGDGQNGTGETILVFCLSGDDVYVAWLRKVGDELWLENNNNRDKLKECQEIAPVIECIKRLK